MNKEELLYRYFSKGLTEAEEQQFYDLIKTDSEFEAQFEFEKNIKRATKEKRTQDLRTKLNAFEEEYQRSKKRILFKSPFWKIAASIALLIAASWFGYQSFFGIDYEKLYNANFEIYPITVYDIDRSVTENSLEREAFVAYGKENYDTAISKFKATDSKDYFPFYIAQSYMALQKFGEAKHLFEKIIQDDQKFVAEAHWFIALIYLQEKKDVQAKMYLEKLINNYDYKKEKAKVLYEILK